MSGLKKIPPLPSPKKKSREKKKTKEGKSGGEGGRGGRKAREKTQELPTWNECRVNFAVRSEKGQSSTCEKTQ